MRRSRTRVHIVLVLLSLLLPAASRAAFAAVVHVDRNASGPVQDGRSWRTAYRTVQEGVIAASPGDEVWVARGTYAENILFKNGVRLYGGFPENATSLSDRDPKAFPTILDGGGAGSVIAAHNCPSPSNRIEGFTIRNGSGAKGAGGKAPGGGIFVSQSTMTIAGNVVTGNSASGIGTGGGGIACGRSTVTIVGNRVSENRSAYWGGGIYCFSSSVTLVNNAIFRNTAGNNGGGIHFARASSPSQIVSNTIDRNVAEGNGGGIFLEESSPLVLNNTLSGNRAAAGGGIACNFYASPTVTNNIVAYGSSGIHVTADQTSNPVFRYNAFHGNAGGNYSGALSSGVADLVADPRFADRERGDYRLRADSPLIDAGDSGTLPADREWRDMTGSSRILKGYADASPPRIDIGAHEFAGKAVHPPSAGPQPAGPPAVALEGTPGENHWYASDVKVVFPSPESAGGQRVEYSFDRVKWEAAHGVLTVSREGETVLYYRTVDASGKPGAPAQQLIRIAHGAPRVVKTAPADREKHAPQGPVVVSFSVPLREGARFREILLKQGKKRVAAVSRVEGSSLVVDFRPVPGRRAEYTLVIPAGAVAGPGGHLLASPVTLTFGMEAGGGKGQGKEKGRKRQRRHGRS